ncbi:hypothetical protein HMPREF1624_03567 [Sporothrix schenckii ATCC 58251]|uniref:Protein kinase domain-containing protein n=1 Tax=Sporothrix schenckii (strain ATCC 58251 / de Perez 2211183) TaxID=1391915 RepID=U7Q0E6_SPOS1|nr:hypothetical protein HMPREF1624_03567 [Sporothrix schenckii ATCC 58251]
MRVGESEDESDDESGDVGDDDMTNAQAHQVQQVIRRMLQYDPKERPTAQELLQDPWFEDEDGDRRAT